MKSFFRFLCESRAQKTLDWIKNKPGNEMSIDDVRHHDMSMFGAIHGEYYTQQNSHMPPRMHKPVHHMVVDHLAAMDPSPDKVHTQQIHQWWKHEDFRAEDAPRVRQTLEKFVAHKKKLGNTKVDGSGGKGSDINSYPSFHHLESHIDALEKKDQGGATQEHFSHPDAPELHNQGGLIVHELKTKDAAKATRYPSCGGRDNKWCTARPETRDEHLAARETYRHDNEGSNAFDSYSDYLYHVETPDKKRWQFHFGTGQFADDRDRMHEPQDLVKHYPELTDVKAFKQHGVKSFPFAKNHAELHGMIDDHFKHTPAKEIDGDDAVEIIKHGTPQHRDLLAFGHEKHKELDNVYPYKVQHALVQHGDERHVHAALDSNEYRNYADRDTWKMAAETAGKKGFTSVLDRLASHQDKDVREKVMEHGTQKHHDAGLKDPSEYVRGAVARFGTDKHRDALINDPEDYVRSKVAFFGNNEHRTKLLNDTSPYVHDAIRRTATNKIFYDSPTPKERDEATSHLQHLAVHGLTDKIRADAAQQVKLAAIKRKSQ